MLSEIPAGNWWSQGLDADLSDSKALAPFSPLYCLPTQLHLLDFNVDPVETALHFFLGY